MMIVNLRAGKGASMISPNQEIKSCAAGAGQGIHVVAKPIGPVCNLNCEYSFYLEKQSLFGPGEQYRMSNEVLSAFITNYVTSQPTPVVEFVWQGGEPTFLGLDFYRRVIELQRPFTGTKAITNSLQTNGTMLTDTWWEAHDPTTTHKEAPNARSENNVHASDCGNDVDPSPV